MIRVNAPTILRYHPTVTGLLLCSRYMNQKHTIVLRASPIPSDTRYTLRGLAPLVSIELPDGPTLAAPTLTTAALAISNYCSTPLLKENVEALADWELQINGIHDAFDTLIEAIAIQHYSGIMEANSRICTNMSRLDQQVATLKVHDNALSVAPLLASLEFMTKEAQVLMGPYESLSSLAASPPDALKKTAALVRSSAALVGEPVGPFHGCLPLAHSLIRKAQTASEAIPKKTPTLSDSATRNHGNAGGSQSGVYSRQRSMPSQRRLF